MAEMTKKTTTAAKKPKPAAANVKAAKKPAVTAVAKKAAAKAVAKKAPEAKAPAAKKTAKPAAKTAAPSAAPAKPVMRVSDEQRYRMVAEAAYYRAESNHFKSDPVRDWIEAESDITMLLSGGR